jgi:hypothetical protein
MWFSGYQVIMFSGEGVGARLKAHREMLNAEG